MDNGMDVQDNAWAQLGRQLAAKDRIIRDLIDERDDYKACAENWEANAKKWSDDWHDLRDERDALAAHLEAAAGIIGNIDSGMDERARWIRDKPIASLKHHDADLLDRLRKGLLRNCSAFVIMTLEAEAAKLRRQAGEAP